MDDHSRFPPPPPFDGSLTWNQATSQQNHWGNSQRPSSFPYPLNRHLPLRGQSSFFFKTRMCVRFNSGRCTNGDSCNFAHGIEELRMPLGNGAAQSALLPHKDHCYSTSIQNPNVPNGHVWMNQSEEQKLNKSKVCRKFYTGEICPYGDKCSFLLVEPGSLQDNPVGHRASSSRQNSVHWKTKLCHRWVTSGKCPFGDQCKHAHGDAELRKLGLNQCEADGPKSKVSTNVADDVFPKIKPKSISLPRHSSRMTTLTLEKCKRIYGDWIDD